jgi:hypothetical protein
MYRGSLSETSVSSGSFGQQSIERASEFAKLVEEGDWEGVIRAGESYIPPLYFSDDTYSYAHFFSWQPHNMRVHRIPLA